MRIFAVARDDVVQRIAEGFNEEPPASLSLSMQPVSSTQESSQSLAPDEGSAGPDDDMDGTGSGGHSAGPSMSGGTGGTGDGHEGSGSAGGSGGHSHKDGGSGCHLGTWWAREGGGSVGGTIVLPLCPEEPSPKRRRQGCYLRFLVVYV